MVPDGLQDTLALPNCLRSHDVAPDIAGPPSKSLQGYVSWLGLLLVMLGECIRKLGMVRVVKRAVSWLSAGAECSALGAGGGGVNRSLGRGW